MLTIPSMGSTNESSLRFSTRDRRRKEHEEARISEDWKQAFELHCRALVCVKVRDVERVDMMVDMVKDMADVSFG